MKVLKKLFVICLGSIFCFGVTLGASLNQVYAKKIELSLANEAPPFFVYTIVSKEFKKLVEEKVGDKVQISLKRAILP